MFSQVFLPITTESPTKDVTIAISFCKMPTGLNLHVRPRSSRGIGSCFARRATRVFLGDSHVSASVPSMRTLSSTVGDCVWEGTGGEHAHTHRTPVPYTVSHSSSCSWCSYRKTQLRCSQILSMCFYSRLRIRACCAEEMGLFSECHLCDRAECTIHCPTR